jgi:PAS domain S-box-containing protein
LAPDESEPHAAYLAGFRRTRVPALSGCRREITVRRRDGSELPMHVSTGHASLREGDVLVGDIAAMSSFKEMARAVRESEATLRALIGNIPGVADRRLMNAQSAMPFMSDATQTLTGYPSPDFVGGNAIRTFNDSTHPDDVAHAWQAVGAPIREHRLFIVEHRTAHADGSVRWMWEHGSAARNEGGDIKWMDGVILGITERREIEQALNGPSPRSRPSSPTCATKYARRRTPSSASATRCPAGNCRPSTGARRIVGGQRENRDGSGYPLGLCETATPIEARIVAIADVFDALTSERPYTKAWSVEDACALLIEQKGRHFQLRRGDLFLDCLPQVLEIKQRWSERAPGTP